MGRHLVSEIDPRQAFADRLTLLWAEAGKPTYERLAREAQNRLAAKTPAAPPAVPARATSVTKQRISDWRTGKKVPRDFAGVSAVIGALVVDARRRRPSPVVDGLYSGAEWQQLWQRAAEATARSGGKCEPGAGEPAPAAPGGELPCPYRGLAPFEADDARNYFGRSRATQALIERVDSVLGPGGMLMLVAPSGAGKSSLLGAGLVPAVREGRLAAPGSATWPIIELTPGPAPFAAVGAHLAQASAIVHGPGAPGPSLSDLSRLRLRADLAAVAARRGGHAAKLVLVVDQFEEVFTLCAAAERRLFIAALAAAAEGPDAPAVVVVGMRSDFYSHCLDHPPLVDALQHRHVVLGPMTVSELTAAITAPAKAAGLRLDPGLADLIIQDAGIREPRAREDPDSAAGILPLLSHALRATWQHRTNGRLTIAGYKATGGIHGAVTQTAERALAGLDPPTQAAAMSVLLRLTRIGEEHSQDCRRQRETRELLVGATDPAAAQRALEALVQARLVRVDAETTQIIHEALLKAWPRLRIQIEQNRAALLGLQRLEDDARLWDDRVCDSSRLYRGDHLADAERWAGSGDLGGPGPSTLAREFLNAAVAARELQLAERARRHARSRFARSAIATLAVFGLVVAALAGAGWLNAARHEQDANFASLLATADRLATSDPSRAAQLNLIAHRLRPDDLRAQGRILSTQQIPHAQVRPGRHGAVYFVDHSPDGHLLATASEAGVVQLQDLTDPALPVLDEVTAGPSWISTALFHPARPLLATTGSDAAVRLWDIHDPRDVVPARDPVPIGHEEISQLAWSPDGRLLVSANGDHTLSVLDLDGPAATPQPMPAVVALPGHGIVRAVVFSSAGDLAAAAGDDGQLVLLRTSPGQLPTVVDTAAAHAGPVQSLAFSPDGSVLVTGSADKTARLWSVAGGMLAPVGEPLSGHTATVWSMAWRDPATLITASKDGAARIWNLANRDLPSVIRTMPTATGGVLAISLAPDGRRLVGGGQDGSTLLWDLPSSILADDIARVYALALSPDRRWLATAAGSTTVRLWDLREPTRPVRAGPLDIGATAFTKNAMAWSGDGRTLVTQGGGAPLRIWGVSDTGAVRLVATVAQQTGYSAAVAISPDGGYLVTGAGNSLAVYDIRDRARPVRLPGPPPVHRSYLTAAMFTRDGSVLVTTSSDGTARAWDLTDPHRITPLTEAHDFGAGQIFAAALSPDNRTLAVAGIDNTVRFWDRTNFTATPTTLSGFDAPPTTLAWSPDGTRLATGGTDQIVRVWRDPTSPVAAAASLTGHTGPVNTVIWGDEHTLVSSGEDQLVLVWNLDLSAQKQRLCATTHGAYPPRRKDEQMPPFPSGPPCPTA